MSDTTYTPYLQIASKLPIQKGNMLYITSDVLQLAKICSKNNETFIAEKFINSLQEAVGKNGTLLFPVFNWDFCKGIAFDYYKTKGKTGALGNVALKMPDFKRTKHPLYSFAVWGKAQDDLISLDNKSSFGKGSPFEYMHNHNALAFVIGLDNRISSFYLYVEEMTGVDYRSHKDFTALYIDENGNTDSRTYSMYVRDLELNLQYDAKAISEVMTTLGLRKYFDINSIPFSLIDLSGMFETLSLDLRYNNSNNLYSYEIKSGNIKNTPPPP